MIPLYITGRARQNSFLKNHNVIFMMCIITFQTFINGIYLLQQSQIPCRTQLYKQSKKFCVAISSRCTEFSFPSFFQLGSQKQRQKSTQQTGTRCKPLGGFQQERITLSWCQIGRKTPVRQKLARGALTCLNFVR